MRQNCASVIIRPVECYVLLETGGPYDPHRAEFRGKFWRQGRAAGLGMKVNAGARIGLVGGNGAGKSTVLRILAGTEEVEGGR